MSSQDDATPSTPAPSAAPTTHVIPGLRAMAIVRWVILAASAALAAGTWWTLVLDPAEATIADARFYCPMHPQITSAEPGSCPICSMRLEPIPTEREHSHTGAHEGEAHAPEAGELAPGTTGVMLSRERLQRSGVELGTVTRETLGGEARWPASIEAREGARAEVRLRSAGFVERVIVRESGTEVRAGQVLAYVYAPEILRAEEELLATLRWTEGPLAAGPDAHEAARTRLELLGMSRTEIDEVVTSRAVRRIIAIRAPRSGTITRVDAVLGGYAEPRDVLFEITDLDAVRVVASVLSPRELVLASSESEARFVPRGGGESIALTLELVEPVVESDTRALRARYVAEGSSLHLGDVGDVVVRGASREVLTVPRFNG